MGSIGLSQAIALTSALIVDYLITPAIYISYIDIMSSTEHNAPWLSIPNRSLITVEHPCVVKNVDRALRTLDTATVGNDISHALNYRRTDSANSVLHLLLNPDDKMSRPIASTCTAANNVLLKVSVPKMSGRRRKRGSDGPFEYPPHYKQAGSQRVCAKKLVRSLQDNAERYDVEPVGKVDRSHVFRGKSALHDMI